MAEIWVKMKREGNQMTPDLQLPLVDGEEELESIGFSTNKGILSGADYGLVIVSDGDMDKLEQTAEEVPAELRDQIAARRGSVPEDDNVWEVK